MAKRATVLTALLVAFSALTACAPSEPEKASTGGEAAAARWVIEATSYPLAYMAGRLAAGLADVQMRAGDAGDPAYWRPSAEEVVAMQQADLIVLNGASYESWLDDVSLPPSRLVDTSAGLRDRLIPLDEALTHSHGLGGEHEHTGTAFTTWLDPTLAVGQAGALAEALAARWPGESELIAQRFAELERDLLALDASLAEAVAGDPGRPVLFSHPVYQYLERRYGLAGHSVHWEPDRAPDEAEWTELQELLAAHPARWMIWEAEPLPAVAERLARMGVASAVFDPCARRPVTGDYLEVMRANVETLREAYSLRD